MKFFALFILLTLIVIVNSRPSRKSKHHRNETPCNSHDNYDEPCGLDSREDDEKMNQRMPDGSFCCGGWNKRLPFDQIQWQNKFPFDRMQWQNQFPFGQNPIDAPYNSIPQNNFNQNSQFDPFQSNNHPNNFGQLPHNPSINNNHPNFNGNVQVGPFQSNNHPFNNPNFNGNNQFHGNNQPFNNPIFDENTQFQSNNYHPIFDGNTQFGPFQSNNYHPIFDQNSQFQSNIPSFGQQSTFNNLPLFNNPIFDQNFIQNSIPIGQFSYNPSTINHPPNFNEKFVQNSIPFGQQSTFNNPNQKFIQHDKTNNLNQVIYDKLSQLNTIGGITEEILGLILENDELSNNNNEEQAKLVGILQKELSQKLPSTIKKEHELLFDSSGQNEDNSMPFNEGISGPLQKLDSVEIFKHDLTFKGDGPEILEKKKEDETLIPKEGENMSGMWFLHQEINDQVFINAKESSEEKLWPKGQKEEAIFDREIIEEEASGRIDTQNEYENSKNGPDDNSSDK